MPPAPQRRDPLSRFNVRVEIDGIPVAGFVECSGLGSETEVEAYREVGDDRVRLLPGRTTYSRIILKRGITLDRSLWDWRQTVVEGRIDRRSGSVILLDGERNEVARWNFVEAWPAKWVGPDLNAQSSDVAIETLEIVHEGLEWVG